jgi:hypothetical protein
MLAFKQAFSSEIEFDIVLSVSIFATSSQFPKKPHRSKNNPLISRTLT